MFASTAMPTVSTTAAMPGRVSAAPTSDNNAVSSTTLADEHDIGDQAEHLVVDRHEHEGRQHAEHHRMDALVDVVLAQARADGPLLDRGQRRRQAAGAQQQRELAPLDRVDAR